MTKPSMWADFNYIRRNAKARVITRSSGPGRRRCVEPPFAYMNAVRRLPQWAYRLAVFFSREPQ